MKGVLYICAFSALLAGCLSAGCLSHAAPARDATSDARRLRAAPGMEEAKAAGPQFFAQGDDEISRSQVATTEGDETGAQIHAETAEASYYRARVQARLARADALKTDADRSLAEATSQKEAYEKTRAELQRQSEDLDVQLRVAREKAFPQVSGPVSPEREKARAQAARSICEEARLLCTAARIVGNGGDEVTHAEGEIDAVEKEIATSGGAQKPPPAKAAAAAPPADRKTPPAGVVDRAARVRVQCLSALEHARKEGALTGTKNDALLAGLSAAGFRPTRTEQGVTVTLTDAFDGGRLSTAGQKKLADLGRVAREEKVGLELVVHDARDPSAAELANDKSRANLATDALAQGGADRANVKVELAGAKLPLFDPEDAQRRAKNARLDVIFVR